MAVDDLEWKRLRPLHKPSGVTEKRDAPAGEPSASEGLSGVRLRGGYIVTERMAGGTLGELYRGEQPTLGRMVAIRFLHGRRSKHSIERMRFSMAARAAAALLHPNIVSLYDFGEHQGRLYLVMELLCGQTVAEWLESRKVVPKHAAVEIAVQVLEALEEAHGCGVAPTRKPPKMPACSKPSMASFRSIGVRAERARWLLLPRSENDSARPDSERTILTDGANVVNQTRRTFPPTDDEPVSGATASESIAPVEVSGIELPGGYVVREVIGRGGMGVLYRADQPALGRSVAIKFLHPNASKMGDARERFAREARAAGSLSHPNSVSIYDFGEHAGQLYLVMELLKGESLDRVLARTPLLPLAEVFDAVLQVLAALEEAHHCGLVHRDIKPENLFVLYERTGVRIKIVDFGLAKTRHGRRLTKRGLVTGTPSYMSPEQITGFAVDNRADLYAVGVLLYELLAGRVPFSGEDTVATMHAHLHNRLPEPMTFAPKGRMTPDVAATLRHALEKDPARRFQTAASFTDAVLKATGRTSAPVPTTTEHCIKCACPVPAGKRYCVGCGAARSGPPVSRHGSQRARARCRLRR